MFPFLLSTINISSLLSKNFNPYVFNPKIRSKQMFSKRIRQKKQTSTLKVLNKHSPNNSVGGKKLKSNIYVGTNNHVGKIFQKSNKHVGKFLEEFMYLFKLYKERSRNGVCNCNEK